MNIRKLVDELQNKISNSGGINRLLMLESTDAIKRVFSLILGILCVIILITIPIIVAIEIIYIVFPIIRLKADEAIFKIDSGGHKHNMLGFMLRDAVEAVKIANTRMIGEESALWIYLKIKCKSVLFICFIVAFVLRGSSSMVQFISNLFSRIIDTMFR